MTRTAALALAGLALLIGAGEAFAQCNPFVRPPYNPYQRPTLSPYLNFLRGGNPAANYYLGVIPERYQRAFDANVQGQLLQIDQRLLAPVPGFVDETAPTLRATGHPSQFLNLAPYYNLPSNLQFNPANTQRTLPAGQRR